ncbi:MAG: DUF1566 domain-containing protein [Bacteroidetes bacterium]|nr:DUF1566 domain-containing protein [Bacteroidota bacterium]
MKNTILNYLLVLVLLFAGCKKNDDTTTNSDNNTNNNDLMHIVTNIVNVSGNNVVLEGYVYNDAGAAEPTVRRGFCWGTSSSPNVSSNDTTIDGSGFGSYQRTITNLSWNTTYYVRAYGVDNFGTQYGVEVSFAIGADPSLPTVTTIGISGIPQIAATGGGDVTSSGGTAVTARGIEYSLSPTFNLSNVTITSGSGTGNFTANLSNLSANTTYYVRAYATNSGGTSYGNVVSFSTLPSPFTIGQSYQGGIIFFIDGTGLHGLIAAASDQGTRAYAPAGTGFLNATGGGQYNTNLIVNLFGASNWAAGLCNSLTLNGYSDWFLPSSGELKTLYDNRAVVGGFNGPDFFYWSSTDNNLYPNSATTVSFIDGTFPIEGKNVGHVVRAVRAF